MVMIKVGILVLLCTTLLSINGGLAETVVDVTKFGAKSDGKGDATMGIIRAWNKACHSSGPAKVLIPRGNFRAGEVIFQGPCTAKPITVEIQGTLLAETDLSVFSSNYWILFERVDNVVVTGGGTINGRGEAAWQFDAGEKIKNAPLLPVSMIFQSVRNSAVHHINFVNSKGFHMKVTDSSGIRVSNLRITAPEKSPNTDGLHISETTNINVTDSVIKTGDDCVSIGDGNSNVLVARITCGPGHGISIGSLGKRPDETDVKGVRVSDCTFVGTTNGARIKTYRASPKLIASDIIFENLIMRNVKRPIVIDQDYNSKNKIQPSNVKIRDVHFRNIKGTSTSKNAVTLTCSQSNPCEGIQFTNVEITPTAGLRSLSPASCVNAKPILKGKVRPAGCGHR